MSFEITNKVALITGAASGLGYFTARTLLKQGLKGIAILDINEAQGQATQEEFNKQFGQDCCIFIKVDVSQESEFEEAFKKTVQKFNQLDIVINNAAVLAEMNWKKCVNTNFGGHYIGTQLAIDTYLPQYKASSEGILINIASIVGLDPMPIVPVYAATKQAVVSLGRSYGAKGHYDHTKVRVLTICPGHMNTAMLVPTPERHRKEYSKRCPINSDEYPKQEPEFIADCLPDIMKNAEHGSVWVIEGGEPPYEVEFKNRQNMRKKSH